VTGDKAINALLDAFERKARELINNTTKQHLGVIMRCQRDLVAYHVVEGRWYLAPNRVQVMTTSQSLLTCPRHHNVANDGSGTCYMYPITAGVLLPSDVAAAAEAAYTLGGAAAWAASVEPHVRYDRTMYRLWSLVCRAKR
jgi:hypothetical protein